MKVRVVLKAVKENTLKRYSVVKSHIPSISNNPVLTQWIHGITVIKINISCESEIYTNSLWPIVFQCYGAQHS